MVKVPLPSEEHFDLWLCLNSLKGKVHRDRKAVGCPSLCPLEAERIHWELILVNIWNSWHNGHGFSFTFWSTWPWLGSSSAGSWPGPHYFSASLGHFSQLLFPPPGPSHQPTDNSFISLLSTCTLSSNTGLLDVPQTREAHLCLSTFTLVPAA